MTVVYEWDVETLVATDTDEHEEGEVISHRHQTCYVDALREAAYSAPEGFLFAIVLVRDDADGRSWAYVDEAGLPGRFTDANGVDGRRVPIRFAREVAKATSPRREIFNGAMQ